VVELDAFPISIYMTLQNTINYYKMLAVMEMSVKMRAETRAEMRDEMRVEMRDETRVEMQKHYA